MPRGRYQDLQPQRATSPSYHTHFCQLQGKKKTLSQASLQGVLSNQHLLGTARGAALSGVKLPPSGSQFPQQCGLGTVTFQTCSASIRLMKRKAGQIPGVKINSSGGRGGRGGMVCVPPSAWLISPASGDPRTHFLQEVLPGCPGSQPPHFSIDLSVLNQSPMMTSWAKHQPALLSQTELKYTLGGGGLCSSLLGGARQRVTFFPAEPPSPLSSLIQRSSALLLQEFLKMK